MDTSFDLHTFAHACGGDLHEGGALVPGPGRGPGDRSLAIRLDPGGPDGFLALSLAGEDPIRCRDHVRAKLGLPAQPARPPQRPAGQGEGAPLKAAQGRALVVQRAADVEMRSIEWLWPGRVALGKLTLIAGEPGLGKSQLAAALAAAVSTGGPGPAMTTAPRAAAWSCSAPRTTPATPSCRACRRPVPISPACDWSRRWKAATAGRTSEGRSTCRPISICSRPRCAMPATPASSSSIRSPATWAGASTATRTPAVRSVLDPLAEMAARWRAAVVGITHFSKSGGVSAINRFIGSIAFVAAARAAFVVTADPESDDLARRLFLPVKNNLAPLGSGLSFRIEQQPLGNGHSASAIAWGEPVTVTAGEILAMSAAVDDRPARADAEEFLRDLLADGPQPVTEIQLEAEDAGIAWRTLNRAKKTIGVAAERHAECERGFGAAGRWYWRLPPGPVAP